MTVEFHRDGPWELPKGWVWISLAAITSDLVAGKRPKGGASADEIGCLSIGGEHLRPDGSIDFSVPRYIPANFAAGLALARLQIGDICIVKDGATTGKTCYFSSDRECFVNEHVFIVRVHPPIDSRFVFYWLWSLAGQMEIQKDHRGSAQGGIGRTVIHRVTVPIAPLAEQRRIVARIDELFMEIADGETALARARADLDTWRRALLKAAVTGELTREWREGRVPNETGPDVLARVKRARVGHKMTKVRTRNVLAEEIEADALCELPENWEWATLGELGDIVGGITVDKKRRPNDPKTVPYLRVANVQRGRLDLTEVKAITVERSTASALRLEPGDILLNEGGDRDKIGRGWVWGGEIDNCIHQNHVFRVRLFDNSLNPYFVSHYANEMGRRFFIEKGNQTTNLASISMSKIRRLRVPIPSVSEMNEAMRLLDEGLAIAADVEAELSAAPLSSAARQSILKAAFEGRLVEQDPLDESADRLLAQLSEQADDVTVPPRRMRRARRAALAAE